MLSLPPPSLSLSHSLSLSPPPLSPPATAPALTSSLPQDRASSGRSKPMPATTTCMVRAIWQNYFHAMDGAEKAAAAAAEAEAAEAAAAGECQECLCVCVGGA